MRRVRRIGIVLLALTAVVLVAAGINGCVARRALEEEIASADRDPETGVIRGCEAVTLEAKGPRACLLIHGWLGSRGEFAALGERLRARGITARLMRLPGHGTTPREAETTTVADYRAAVCEEYRALRAEHADVSVVGFSMGGALATLLAAEERPDRLVLVAPYFEVTYRWFYVLPPETWTRLLRPLVRYVVKAPHAVHVNREGVGDGIFSYGVVPLDAALTLYEIGRLARREETLSAVRCPVLLLQSRGDESACPEAAEGAFRALGSARKRALWFERSNHHLLWDHDGEEAADAIATFLAGS